jgi:hypothetical protein
MTELLNDVTPQLRRKILDDAINFMLMNSNAIRVDDKMGMSLLIESNYIHAFEHLRSIHGEQVVISVLMDSYVNTLHTMVIRNPELSRKLLDRDK